ncbi:hypothetical protein ACI01nite_26010 [Acetobacter cibinongensis]|uniref:Hedgehog/Intein (Hint) domain-containing protein n=2 Tax=Acetobacter cibinongensis TaxID=146475 RepID=A0ABQ0V809_9PROT|nr:Hint domain-containing protein [Acetobacter cibinongensis]GEL59999.1 hypothetical protein ACI01nite_26010 [Acetobacter cibinongensis]
MDYTVNSSNSPFSQNVNEGEKASVISGGVTSNVLVSGGNETVYLGGSAVSTIVAGSVTSVGYLIASGGAIQTATVNARGSISLSNSASADQVTLTDRNAGLTVLSTASATNTVVDEGAVFVSGGQLFSTIVGSGAVFVEVNGHADNTTVIAGRVQAWDGGVVTSTTVTGSGSVVVIGTGVASGTALQGVSAGLAVTRGGTAVDTTVASGAFIVANSGTLAGVTTVEQGGFVSGYSDLTLSGAVSNAGTISNGTLVSSATLSVTSGGVTSNVVVSGGTETLYQNGSAISAVVEADGDAVGQIIASGGSVQTATVNFGGSIDLLSGASADHVTLTDSNTGLTVFSTASATNTVADKGTVFVSGGQLSSTTVVSGSVFVNANGHADNTIVSTGRVQAWDGGVVTSTTVTGSGTVQVIGTGVASGTVLQGTSAGLAVFQGGTAVDTTVASGTFVLAASGTLAGVTTVEQGGFVSGYSDLTLSGAVSNAGTISNGTLVSSATLSVTSGGVTSNVVVSGGTETLYQNGSAVSAVVEADGNAVGQIIASGGSVQTATVNFGGSIDLLSGASADHVTLTDSNAGLTVFSTGSATNTVADKGTVFVSGGQLSSTTVGSGFVFVNASGHADNTTVSTGRVQAWDGGVVSSTTVTGSGSVVVFGTGVASGTVLQGGSAGLAVFQGGTATNTTVGNGAYISAVSGTLAGQTIASNGSVVSLDADSKLEGSLTLEDGAKATLFAGAGGTVIMDGSQNTGLVVSGLASGGNLSTVISGFDGTSGGHSDGIMIAGLSKENVKSVVNSTDGNSVTIDLVSGSPIVLNILGIGTQQYIEFTQNGMLFEVCFLAGSMIRTTAGDVAVETLCIGDLVQTWDWKAKRAVERSVIWTGRKSMTVRTDLADDQAGYPVRIRKDAIADNVPSQDLLVTPEHCLFFENLFVPVRMLVNGSSIFYDRSITAYDYFHIETEEHAVIWANDMLTESYLDTGNRSTFQQDGGVVRLFARASEKTWDADGATNLCVERSFVEPLFNTLADRAAAQGFAYQAEVLEVTQDSDIHLVTTLGQIIRPARQKNGSVVFMLPADVEAVQITTRTSQPSQAVGPFVDDRRQLGVLVGQVALFDGKNNHAITTHLDQQDLLGWDVQESVPCRWTNGNATLPLPVMQGKGLRMLTLQIIAAGPYVINKVNKKIRNLENVG